MKIVSVILLFLLAVNFTTNAQGTSALSNAEKFSKSPGLITRSSIVYDVDYWTDFGHNIYQRVSLIKYAEYSGKDTITGLKFYGSLFIKPIGTTATYTKKYSVTLDYDELNNIIVWFDLVKKEVANKTLGREQLAYIPKTGSLLFRYYDDTFEVQYDKSDDNSIFKGSNHTMDSLQKKLNEIKALASRVSHN